MVLEKYNHKCTKEINQMPSRRFSDVPKFQIFLLKIKKINKYGLNNHRLPHITYFEVFFLKIPMLKTFYPWGITYPSFVYMGSIVPIYTKIISYYCYYKKIVLNFKMIGLK